MAEMNFLVQFQSSGHSKLIVMHIHSDSYASRILVFQSAIFGFIQNIGSYKLLETLCKRVNHQSICDILMHARGIGL